MRLTTSALIPLFGFLCYTILLVLVIVRRTKDRVHRFFMLYLTTMIVWSFASFMMRTNLRFLNTLFWNRFMVVGSGGMPVAFFAFVQVFLRRRNKLWLYVGLVSYVLTQGSNISGLLIRDAYFLDGLLYNEYGPALALTGGSWVFFVGYSAFDLVREIRRTKDTVYRNRIRYLLVVIIIMAVGSFTNATALSMYPVDIALNAACAFLIAYAIFRYRLLDITLVVRKGLLYSIPTIIIGAAYFLSIYFVFRVFQALTSSQIFLISLIVAIVTAAVAQPIRDRAQLWIDKAFFREKLDVRRMLQRLTVVTASIIDLEVLTGMILDEVSQTMHIERMAFFLKQAKQAEFTMVAHRGLEDRAQLSMGMDHVIVDWLHSHDVPLSRQDIEVMPHFKALWAEEREALENLGMELFIRLMAKSEMVGFVAIGPKLSRETYSQDDRLTLTTLANQTAVTVENARLYWELQSTLAALRHAHDELEMRVVARTSELADANKALQEEIAERQRVENQIRVSLKEKEVLLSEIHHRVKNNLQIISSLLYLQAMKTKDSTSLDVLRDSQNRVRSMALVHEKLYQSKDLANIGFAEYVQSLVNHLFQSYDIERTSVRLNLQIEDVFLGVNTAIPCGLIINELVSNCLKYAFVDRDEGNITINLRSNGDQEYELDISDDGVGVPKGMNIGDSASLGLQLVNTLVTQLDGSLRMTADSGTSFHIDFKSAD